MVKESLGSSDFQMKFIYEKHLKTFEKQKL